MFARDWYLHPFQTSTAFLSCFILKMKLKSVIPWEDTLVEKKKRRRLLLHCPSFLYFFPHPERQIIFFLSSNSKNSLMEPSLMCWFSFHQPSSTVPYCTKSQPYSLDKDSRSCSTPITKAVMLARYDARSHKSHSSTWCSFVEWWEFPSPRSALIFSLFLAPVTFVVLLLLHSDTLLAGEKYVLPIPKKGLRLEPNESL